jgi:hypothetical protein
MRYHKKIRREIKVMLEQNKNIIRTNDEKIRSDNVRSKEKISNIDQGRKII